MSDAIDEARRVAQEKVDAALYEYASALAADDDEETGPVMLFGWAVVFEYTQESMEDRGVTAARTVVPQTQTRANSRGLFALGGDAFTMR
ncbi:hypothetical protein SEA_FIRECASTLE_2 [Microbacterium phage FireCastle]